MSGIPDKRSHVPSDDAPDRVAAVKITWLERLKVWYWGIDKALYARARRAGVTFPEILEIPGIPNLHLKGYIEAREARATHAEALEALRRGINLSSYAKARKAGATDAEVLEAHGERIKLYLYAEAREAGAIDAEVLEAHGRRINLDRYAKAREEYGASHEVTLIGHDNDIDVASFARALKAGAIDAEVLEAHAKGINVESYACAREADATHAEVLEAHAEGVNLYNYACLRLYAGANHNDALDACSKDIVPWRYVREVSERPNASHAEVVKALKPPTREDLRD